MSDDYTPRVGPNDSGSVTVVAGDGNTPQTVYSIDSDVLYRVERIEWSYSSSSAVATEFAIHDDADGTSNANVSDERHRVLDVASGGDSGTVDFSGSRPFEEDVLVVTDGNQDADLEVTVFGEKLTDLRDMAQ